ncbi:hypothetical protein WOC76_00495 [Methylocystis sp. IM3]|uniref:hypothetical protein n=1 Tax=unclassified Methylocystis TaxID=2625913 RepID=UPI0030FC0EEB
MAYLLARMQLMMSAPSRSHVAITHQSFNATSELAFPNETITPECPEFLRQLPNLMPKHEKLQRVRAMRLGRATLYGQIAARNYGNARQCVESKEPLLAFLQTVTRRPGDQIAASGRFALAQIKKELRRVCNRAQGTANGERAIG